MMSCYFGVPGCGKSTMLARFAVRGLRKKRRYDNVYTNFYVKGCKMIDFDVLDEHKVYNSLIIIDEMALCADNRKFREFKQGIRDFIILHRHLGNDIIYATQSYDLVDLKIRTITDELWYMSKTVVPIFNQFTCAKRIYRKVNINEHSADLTLGYRFCNFFESLFVSNYKIVFRPFYYRYFNSFEEGVLEKRTIYDGPLWAEKQPNLILQLLNKLEELKQSGRR